MRSKGCCESALHLFPYFPEKLFHLRALFFDGRAMVLFPLINHRSSDRSKQARPERNVFFCIHAVNWYPNFNLSESLRTFGDKVFAKWSCHFSPTLPGDPFKRDIQDATVAYEISKRRCCLNLCRK
jgi:hypothetical protein